MEEWVELVELLDGVILAQEEDKSVLASRERWELHNRFSVQGVDVS